MVADNQFIFVRHGQSQANADGVVNGDDSPLSRKGIGQAEETAKNLQGLGIELIVCSPLQRAKQTAEIIATTIGTAIPDIRVVNELRERGFGQLEGRPMDRDPLNYYLDDDELLGFEPRTLLYDRMNDCLGILSSQTKGRMTLVVGHSISGFFLLQAAAKKLSVDDFDAPPSMKNAAIVKVTY